jgi:energy-coupling factor transport system substrate-specific component
VTVTTPRNRNVNAIALVTRTNLGLLIAAALTVVVFCWPLVVTPDPAGGQTTDAVFVFALVVPLVIATVLAQLADGGIDTKTIAMLGVLSALGAGLRPLGAGTAGIELVFFLLIVAGRVFGPGFGFALGSTTLFASALLTGGVGPWLPFQMLAASWVAFGAGVLPRVGGRLEILLLAVYGAVSSLLFGLMMNLTFWPFTLGAGTDLSFVPGDPIVDNLRRFLLFDLTTSLGWDVGRAITTALMLALFAGPIARILRRTARKASFDRSLGP